MATSVVTQIWNNFHPPVITCLPTGQEKQSGQSSWTASPPPVNRFSPCIHRTSKIRISCSMFARQMESIRHRFHKTICRWLAVSTSLFLCSAVWLLSWSSPHSFRRRYKKYEKKKKIIFTPSIFVGNHQSSRLDQLNAYQNGLGRNLRQMPCVWKKPLFYVIENRETSFIECKF